MENYQKHTSCMGVIDYERDELSGGYLNLRDKIMSEKPTDGGYHNAAILAQNYVNQTDTLTTPELKNLEKITLEKFGKNLTGQFSNVSDYQLSQ